MPEVKKLTVNEFLSRLDNGGATEDLRAALEDVTAKVADGPKNAKGKVTLTLSVQKVTGNQLIITDSVATSAPKPVKQGTTFFVHPEGGVATQDPDQGRLPVGDRF